MIVQKIRKNGNSYSVTIPKSEIEKRQLKEGDVVGIDLRKVDVSVRPHLTPDISEALEYTLETYDEALRILAE